MNAEQYRLAEDQEGKDPWKKWGPYLSEPYSEMMEASCRHSRAEAQFELRDDSYAQTGDVMRGAGLDFGRVPWKCHPLQLREL